MLTHSSASQPLAADLRAASAPDFDAALLDARLHALTVLRSILDLATLSPEARAVLLSDKTGQLNILRESRLAAAQILSLPINATGSPRHDRPPSRPPPPPATSATSPPSPPLSPPDVHPRQPVHAAPSRAAGSSRQLQREARERTATLDIPAQHRARAAHISSPTTTLLEHTTPITRLLARAGAPP